MIVVIVSALAWLGGYHHGSAQEEPLKLAVEEAARQRQLLTASLQQLQVDLADNVAARASDVDTARLQAEARMKALSQNVPSRIAAAKSAAGAPSSPTPSTPPQVEAQVTSLSCLQAQVPPEEVFALKSGL